MDFNKNEKQNKFSTIKGVLKEINEESKFSNITLLVGHERTREVNMVMNSKTYESIKDKLKLEEKITVSYYITSRKKEDKWSTMANVLTIF
jgi:dihydrofolate reductase